MRSQNSEDYRAHLSRKASRAKGSNERIIEQRLEQFNVAASLRNYMVPMHRSIPSPSLTWTDAQMTSHRVTYRLQVLKRHGVLQQTVPIRDQLKADLASHFWMRNLFHSGCSKQVLLSLKKARRGLTNRDPLSGGYVNLLDMGRERDLAVMLMLKWLDNQKRIMLILMAHNRGPPTAASSSRDTPFILLPYRVLVKILKYS